MKTLLQRLLIVIMSGGYLAAYAPVNFNLPYDSTWYMPEWVVDKRKAKVAPLRVGVTGEFGSTTKSRNLHNDKVNLLELYQPTQSSIAMLLGADTGSSIDDLLRKVSPATDDGVRGNFKVGGEYEEAALDLYGQYDFDVRDLWGHIVLSLHVPLRSMRVKNVTWTDQTNQITAADLRVRSFLTDDIVAHARDLGGLDIGSWDKTGLGDLALYVRWYKDFYHVKRNLKHARLTAQFGLTAPTGKKTDADKAFSLPLGNDGSFGIPGGMALDLGFKWHINAGIELTFLKIFDDTRDFRLKTDVNQTDFLLLNKGRARKSFGALWKYNLYVMLHEFVGGLSFKFNYQHVRRDDHRLYVQSDDFNNTVANTAESLKGMSYHNAMFILSYNFNRHWKKSALKPQVSFFYKAPFNGRRAFIADTLGASVNLNF